MHAPIFLFTDFGSADVYVGQVKAVLHEMARSCAVIDLLHDAPAFEIEASAHLIAALAGWLPANAVVMAVVDPGVGGARDALAVHAGGRWYVGPDNGLLSIIVGRAGSAAVYSLRGFPPPPSASFHGRDLFAPAAAVLATRAVPNQLQTKPCLDVAFDAADCARIIHIDHYGNAMTGLRAVSARAGAVLTIEQRTIPHARVFSDVPEGELFWYENSIGLVEIAANRASAAALLGLDVGAQLGFFAGA